MVIGRKRTIKETKQQQPDDHNNVNGGIVYLRGCTSVQVTIDEYNRELEALLTMSPTRYKGHMTSTPYEARCIIDKVSSKRLCFDENMETYKAPEAEELGEGEGNTTPAPYEEACEFRKLPAIAQKGEKLASVSIILPANNNENVGNSPASSAGSANSNNREPMVRVQRNDEENFPGIQVTPSAHVARSVMDPNVSPFQGFYNDVSQKFELGIPVIAVHIEGAVFGRDAFMEVHLDLNDVRCMCSMEDDVSMNCVMAYIRHLYDILKMRGIQHKYEFINPALVSYVKDAALSDMITSRLKNSTCEWVVIPFSQEAGWLLAVVQLENMRCYWLDPSDPPTPSSNIRPFVTLGLKSLQKDGVRRPSPCWYIIKCPKQQRSVESGLYVMKFMRVIIDESNMLTRSQLFRKSAYEQNEIDAYKQNEIDEVRLEWIQTVEPFV